jgi:SPP1 gp7 family putative phage head morphogenesis protein
MYVKKTTGYVIGPQNDCACPTEKESSSQPYRVFKTGRVLTLKEERETRTKKSADIASIANQGFDYYQVTSNQGACEKCEEHNGAIYPVAEAKEYETLPPFHPNCKCTIRGFSTKNPNHDPWLGETVFWLEIMYVDGTLEQKAQKLIDFYHLTEYPVDFIAQILSAIDEISNIGERMAAFFERLDNYYEMLHESDDPQEKTTFSKVVTNHEVPSSSIEWNISNVDFLDSNAITYEEILYIIQTQTRNSEWADDAERYAQAIYDISQNFAHADFRLISGWRHPAYEEKMKALIPEGAIGINPKVILATLLCESAYGSTTHRYFGGSKKVGELSFEEQLDIAVNQYIQYYYWGVYAQGNEPDLYDIQIQTGTGGSYTPANAAMYARGQYCTDDLTVFEIWQNTFLEGIFL